MLRGQSLEIISSLLLFAFPLNSFTYHMILVPVRQSILPLNPILHMWFRDNGFTCDGSSTIQVFPLLFSIGMVILPYLSSLLNGWRLSCHTERGRAACSGGCGDSLMTHTAGSHPKEAFKYVMASEPYTWYSKPVMASLSYIKIYCFLKPLIAFLFRNVCKKLDFSPK